MNSTLADKLLKKQRESINRLDSILIFTLAERFKLTQEVGKIKAQNNLNPSDPVRERKHLSRLHKLAESADLDPEIGKKFINFIFAEVIQQYAKDTQWPQAQNLNQDKKKTFSHSDGKTSNRTVYKERVNPTHCGDWLDRKLDGCFQKLTENQQIEFDVKEFRSFLRLNGVDINGQLAQISESRKSGWHGRYRMYGRILLEQAIHKRGTIKWKVNETVIEDKPPQDWLDAMVKKYSNTRS